MQRTRKFLATMALVVAGSLILTACGPKDSKPTGTNNGTDKPAETAKVMKPAVGGELLDVMQQDPDNFNPAFSSSAYGSQIYSLVYSTLFEYDDKWTPKGHLAESWSFSADNKIMTIKLRQGVKFHDGSELTADDVVFTFKTLMDKDYTGPRSTNVKNIADIKVGADKYQVIVEMKQPSAAIYSNLSTGILSKKAFEGVAVKDIPNHKVTMNPMGSGPYKFVEYVRGQYVTLERNDNWFMKDVQNQQGVATPLIKTYRAKIIPETATQQAALENGEVDVHTPDASNMARLEKDFKDKFNFFNYERNGWGYMTLNVTRPHLDNKLVRQAMDMALDKAAVISSLMDGRAVIPNGPIPPVSWAFDASIKARPFDVAGAKKLIEQAGYKLNAQGIAEKDGKPLKLTFYGTSGSPLIEGIALIAQKNWKQIGIDLEVQLMDFNAMTENFMKPGKFDVSFSGFSLSLDPDSGTALFHSTQVNAFNRGRFNNKKVDELLESGSKELDQNKRKAIYSEYQKIIVDEVPVIFVYSNLYTDVVAKKVKGGVRNFPGSGPTDIFKWWIEEKAQ